jgi:pimeloyl-ACP methyl ester carboxylesterase
LVEFIEANGIEIAYERVGAGPPLVFVHGAAEDSRIWQPQLASLADEFTVVAWDEPGAGRSSDLPENFGLAGFADVLAALIETLELGPAHVAGLSWGGTVVLELYRSHPTLVATLIMIDTYAGWKGSLPADEVEARVAGARQVLAAPHEIFDPTLPGLFAGDPPGEFVPLLAAIAADVRPATLGRELGIMAEADLSDLLLRVAVPTLLIWGQLDVRSPLTVAHQLESAIADTRLVVNKAQATSATSSNPGESTTLCGSSVAPMRRVRRKRASASQVRLRPDCGASTAQGRGCIGAAARSSSLRRMQNSLPSGSRRTTQPIPGP